MGAFVNRTGKTYGQLTVLFRDLTVPKASNGNRVKWVCQCSCGKKKSITGHSLQSGDAISCGCYHKNIIGLLNKTHGQTQTKEYSSYIAAKMRCTNAASPQYMYYGGRGIKFLWESFEHFYADMGTRPIGKTLDRIDVNGNYEKTNCRWATATEQQRNKRCTRPFIITDVAKEHGIPRTSLNKAYIRLGDINEAIKYCKTRRPRAAG